MKEREWTETGSGSAMDPREERLRMLLREAYPGAEPDGALEQRAAALVARHAVLNPGRRELAPRPLRWRLAMGAAVAAGLLGAAGLMWANRHTCPPTASPAPSIASKPSPASTTPGQRSFPPKPHRNGRPQIAERHRTHSGTEEPGLLPTAPPSTRDGEQTTKRVGPAPRVAQGVPGPPAGVQDPDMLRLNEGAAMDLPPTVPEAAALPEPPSLLQERSPGGRLVDDLLLLNPIRLAAADDDALAAAASALAAENPITDARLQRKVILHAMRQPLSDLLGMLSRASGVALLARIEIADEPITVWVEDRPLIDVMRDLRHLRGYLWSRSKREDQYVYSLWQDAGSRAREEAEQQRLAMEQQREFLEDLRKRLRALNATDAELKALGREDPYLIAQMKHPVVRGAYQWFATLTPDQQAPLLQGQTPNRSNGAGMVLDVFPLESYPDPNGHGMVISDPRRVARNAPIGDVVRLRPEEMTPAQRTALQAILRGAAARREREDFHEGATELRAPDLQIGAVSIFRWGDPFFQGLSLHVDFRSGGRPWALTSNFAIPPASREFYNDLLRKGQFNVWDGGQDDVDRCLGWDKAGKRRPTGNRQTDRSVPTASRPVGPGTGSQPPDLILDAPVSLVWRLARRGSGCNLQSQEILAALQRDLGHPIVTDSLPRSIEQPGLRSAEFRVEKRPLREVLGRLFPKHTYQTSGGTLFITQPPLLRARNEVPRVVREFLQTREGAFTLDDMALLARSLSPWQLARLGAFLPETVLDQTLELQDLLKLYGELAPAQRTLVGQGLPFGTMTPTQRALYLSFAQRKRPFVEAWRFQQGTLRVSTAPVAQKENPARVPLPVAQVTFAVRFQEEDAQAFALDLYPQPERRWNAAQADLVGHPFPFPWNPDGENRQREGSAWQSPLTDPGLRKKALVVLFTWPFAQPYAGTQPSPEPFTWARRLAERLRDTGVTVVHVHTAAQAGEPRVREGEALPPSRRRGPVPGEPRSQNGTPLPNLIQRTGPGDPYGQPLDSVWGGWNLPDSPTVMVVSRDEVVRAMFKGQEAWDMAAIERAARSLTRAAGVSSGAR
jgi:hypothetical protein